MKIYIVVRSSALISALDANFLPPTSGLIGYFSTPVPAGFSGTVTNGILTSLQTAWPASIMTDNSVVPPGLCFIALTPSLSVGPVIGPPPFGPVGSSLGYSPFTLLESRITAGVRYDFGATIVAPTSPVPGPGNLRAAGTNGFQPLEGRIHDDSWQDQLVPNQKRIEEPGYANNHLQNSLDYDLGLVAYAPSGRVLTGNVADSVGYKPTFQRTWGRSASGYYQNVGSWFFSPAGGIVNPPCSFLWPQIMSKGRAPGNNSLTWFNAGDAIGESNYMETAIDVSFVVDVPIPESFGTANSNELWIGVPASHPGLGHVYCDANLDSNAYFVEGPSDDDDGQGLKMFWIPLSIVIANRTVTTTLATSFPENRGSVGTSSSLRTALLTGRVIASTSPIQGPVLLRQQGGG